MDPDFAIQERHRDDVLIEREVSWESEPPFVWPEETDEEEGQGWAASK